MVERAARFDRVKHLHGRSPGTRSLLIIYTAALACSLHTVLPIADLTGSEYDSLTGHRSLLHGAKPVNEGHLTEPAGADAVSGGRPTGWRQVWHVQDHSLRWFQDADLATERRLPFIACTRAGKTRVAQRAGESDHRTGGCAQHPGSIH